MTFMLILGAIAALYLILLILRLASLALPLYAGIGAGFWMIDRGAGYPAALASGLLLGFTILIVGRLICGLLPPLFRIPVALLFLLPAGFAGYQAGKGLGGLALGEGPLLECVALAGASAAAIGAWRNLEGAPAASREDESLGTVP